jgi:hypothetical protein
MLWFKHVYGSKNVHKSRNLSPYISILISILKPAAQHLAFEYPHIMVYTYLRSQKCKTSHNLSPSRDLWLNSKNVLILNGPKTRNVHWSNTNLLELLIVELHRIDRLSLVWILKTTTKPSFIILQKIYFMMNWSIWHGAFLNQFSWKS